MHLLQRSNRDKYDIFDGKRLSELNKCLNFLLINLKKLPLNPYITNWYLNFKKKKRIQNKGYLATTLSATGNRLTNGQLKVALAVLTFSTSFSMILTSLQIINHDALFSTLMIRKLLLLYGRRYITPICQSHSFQIGRLQLECLAIQANVNS